jgi:hypothetical protein
MRHNNPDIYDIESDAPDRREFFSLKPCSGAAQGVAFA